MACNFRRLLWISWASWRTPPCLRTTWSFLYFFKLLLWLLWLPRKWWRNWLQKQRFANVIPSLLRANELLLLLLLRKQQKNQGFFSFICQKKKVIFSFVSLPPRSSPPLSSGPVDLMLLVNAHFEELSKIQMVRLFWDPSLCNFCQSVDYDLVAASKLEIALENTGALVRPLKPVISF